MRKLSSKTVFITSVLQLVIFSSIAVSYLSFAEQSSAEGGEAKNQKDTEQFEEIVVTGQKVERSLQDTTTSVSVTTLKDMENYTVNDLKDIFVKTANVTSTFGDSGFTIRGISNTNVTGAGIGDLATVYIDGAPMPRDFVASGSAGVWDVAQVEVLRGPQSTLQGRNSLAGAVIVNTADPSYEWSAKAQAQAYDENAERRVGVAVGGPIVDDWLAFRIAGQWHEEDGFIYNETRNEYASEAGSKMLRAKLLFEPSVIPLRILLSHTLDDREGPQTFSFIDSNKSSWDNRKVYSDVEFKNDSKLNLTIANISYDFSDELKLTSITTYNKVERQRLRDVDFTPQSIRYSDQKAEPETTTQEFRLNLDNDYVSAVFGAYYSDYDNSNQRDFSRFRLLPETVGLKQKLEANPLVPAAFIPTILGFYQGGFSLDTVSVYPQEVETQALFTDVTVFLGDHVRLLAGLRYDREKQKLFSSQEVVIAEPLPDPATTGPLAPIITSINAQLQGLASDANSVGKEQETDFDALLPKLGVAVDFTDNANLGFVVQRGYRSGGGGINAAQAKLFEFDQEFTWNYELSFRSQWFDKRLTLNANAFYVDWEDQQVTVYLSSNVFDNETRNAGSSHLYGAELELAYAMTSEFDIYASLGHTKTEFDDFKTRKNGVLVDYSGNEFSNAPKYTLAIGGSWHSESGFFISVDANHGSKRFARVDEDQSAGPNLPERTLVNAKVGYRADNYGVYLVGTNLFDDEYVESSFERGGATIGRYGQPRTVGLVMEVEL